MNSKLPIKPKHLFVVKEEGAPNEARMVSAESLSADQQLTARRYIALSQSSGVMVGALVAPELWDLRPLLLQEGQLHLVRFSDPAVALHKSKLSFLRATCEKIQISGTSCVRAFGEIEGQVWVRRRYFPETLADELVRSSALHPLQLAQKIIRTVSAMHSSGVIHGHLCLQNIAVENQEIFLLDHSFLIASLPREPDPAFLPPELRNSFVPAYTADIFGLGVVLKSLGSTEVGSEQANCVERMLSPDPAARPSLEAVRDVFMPREAQQGRSAQVATLSSQSGVATGKLVSRPGLSKPEDAVDSRIHSAKIINPQVPVVAANQLPEWKRSSQVQPEAIQPAPVTPSPVAVPEKTPTWFLGAIVAALIAGIVVLGAKFLDRYHSPFDANNPPDAAWFSNQPSRMQTVAEAAVAGDSQAQAVIVSDTLKGTNRPLLRSNLIRFAFNPAWERDLSDSDRQIVLRLALARLLNDRHFALPALRDAHPAIAMAIAGDLPDLDREQGTAELADVPLDRLAFLPAPYGELFAQLEKTGVSNLGQLPARALSHILSGDASDLSIQAFFSTTEKSQSLLRLALLYPLAKRAPKLGESIFSVLSAQGAPLSDSVQWFAAEDLPQWAKLPKIDLLGILIGEVPGDGLSFEQLSDLLQFPMPVVRQKAQAQLVGTLIPPKLSSSVAFLASRESALSRFQSVSLLSALRMEGEPGYALLGSVLSTRPDAHSILGLLLSRSNVDKVDPVNVELARYLTKLQFATSIEELKRLAVHPEQLARAIAYSRLDPTIPPHRKLLEAAVTVEPNARLKAQVAEKLQGVQVTLPEESAQTAEENSAAPSDADLAPF